MSADLQNTASEPSQKSLGLGRSTACAACAKAKTKCIPSDQIGNKCHRYDFILSRGSLLTEEVATVFGRIANPVFRRANDLKLLGRSSATLEKKLDTIVDILRFSNVLHRGEVPPKSHDSSKFSNTEESAQVNHAFQDSITIPSNCVPDSRAANLESCPDYLSPFPSHVGFDISDHDADTLLLKFRTSMASYCPFVVILPTLNMQQFRCERPFLWKAVMVAASHRSPTIQTSLGSSFFEDLITGLILRGESSLDKLQALLVHIGWLVLCDASIPTVANNLRYQYHAVNLNQAVNIIHLIKGLMITLDLHRTSKFTAYKQGAFDISETDASNDTPPGKRTLEEYRAFAGGFYCLSMLPPGSNIESMPYTASLDEACRTLSSVQEYESDVLLVQSVKLQQIARAIKRTFSDVEIGFGSSGSMVPTRVSLNIFQRELEKFRKDLPAELKSNPVISINYSIAEINLYEVGLRDLANPNFDKLDRLNALSSCLRAIKSFFEDQVMQKIDISIEIPYTTWGQVGYALLIAAKLTNFTLEEWDLKSVRSIFNLSPTLDFLHAKLNTIVTSRGISPPQLQTSDTAFQQKDIFYRFARQITRVKLWYESYNLCDPPNMVNIVTHPFNYTEEVANVSLDVMTPESQVQDDDGFANWDEGFWRDFVDSGGDSFMGFFQ